jgi:hypothetical protein
VQVSILLEIVQEQTDTELLDETLLGCDLLRRWVGFELIDDFLPQVKFDVID